MMQMMQGMQDPAYRENIESRLSDLKADPALADIMKEIETGGPAAMMKCANPLRAAATPCLAACLESLEVCLLRALALDVPHTHDQAYIYFVHD